MGAKKVSTQNEQAAAASVKKPTSDGTATTGASSSSSNVKREGRSNPAGQQKKIQQSKGAIAPDQKAVKRRVSKKDSVAATRAKAKISNELKNLGIDILQDGPKGFGLKQSTAASSECKTSICEMVKTKSRSSVSPANYVPFKVNKIKSSGRVDNKGDKKVEVDDKLPPPVTDKGDNNQIKVATVVASTSKAAVPTDGVKSTGKKDKITIDPKQQPQPEGDATKKIKSPIGSPKKGADTKKVVKESEKEKVKPKDTEKKKSKIFKNSPTLPTKAGDLLSNTKKKIVAKKTAIGFIKPITKTPDSNDCKPKDIYDFHESGSGSEPLSPIPVQETPVKKAPIYKRKAKPKIDKSESEKEDNSKNKTQSENDSAEDFKTPLAKLKSKVKEKETKLVKKKKPDDNKGEISKKKPPKILSDSDQEVKSEKKKPVEKKKAPVKKPKPVKPSKVTTDEESEEESDSDDSIVTRFQQRRAAKTRHMKKYGFWSGPKRHREASLNALAKVHCLYENESRSALEQNLIKAAKLESLKDMEKVQKAAQKAQESDSEEDSEKEEDNKR